MNNLSLSLAILASGAVVFLGEHHSVGRIRAATRLLAQQRAEITANLELANQRLDSVRTSLNRNQEELAQARSEAANAAEAEKEISLDPFDPVREGAWPAEKPYFYLLKKRIPEVIRRSFTRDDRLSEETKILLGMNDQEEAAANQAIQSFYDRMRQLQVKHAERMEPPPGVNTETHQEITCRIPPLISEVREARDELESGWRAALGDTRTGLLTKLFPAPWYGRTGDHEFLITYCADAKPDGTIEHRVSIMDGVGRGGSDSDVLFPATPGTALWQWRHLFGEKPLIPRPINPQK
jgi:hypothetical protein